MNAKLHALLIMIPFVVGAAALSAGAALGAAHILGVHDEATGAVVGFLAGILIGPPIGFLGFHVTDAVCTRRYGEYWLL